MRTIVTASDMHDAVEKLTEWRQELEQSFSLGNLRRSTKMIQKYMRKRDVQLLDEVIMRLEFEIDWIANKHGKILKQEGLTWTLAE
jgi:hypothetical protein